MATDDEEEFTHSYFDLNYNEIETEYGVDNMILVPPLNHTNSGKNEISVTFKKEVSSMIVDSFQVLEKDDVIYQSDTSFTISEQIFKVPPTIKV